jgi:hypothetical protein
MVVFFVFGLVVITFLAPIVSAQIASDLKSDLKAKIAAIKAVCVESVKSNLKATLSNHIRATLEIIATAKEQIDDGKNTDEILALRGVWDVIANPQTPSGKLASIDVTSLESIREKCEQELAQLEELVTTGQTDGKIGGEESFALSDQINALRNQINAQAIMLVGGVETLIEEAGDSITEAIEADTNGDSDIGACGAIEGGAGSCAAGGEDEPVQEARTALRQAKRALETILKIEKRISENLKYMRKTLREMKKIVSLAKNTVAVGTGVMLAVERAGLTFRAQGAGVSGFQVKVYGLNGSLVYDSGMVSGSVLRWNYLNNDGAPLANGVYLYVVTVKGADGQRVTGKIQKLVVLR